MKNTMYKNIIVGLIFGIATMLVIFLHDGIIHLEWGLWVGAISWASTVLIEVIKFPTKYPTS